MKTDSLTKRVRLLESKLPSPKDLQAQEERAFLGSLSCEELRTLEGIAERYQTHGIEPTPEECAFLNNLKERHMLSKHDKYFAEIEHETRP
jgi:hypothetical protein